MNAIVREGYHPKEFGATTVPQVAQQTGLVGVVVLFACCVWSLIIAACSVPFLLLGVAEIVADSPTHWRVRLIRRGSSS